MIKFGGKYLELLVGDNTYKGEDTYVPIIRKGKN